jgi:hypothetical protein
MGKRSLEVLPEYGRVTKRNGGTLHFAFPPFEKIIED